MKNSAILAFIISVILLACSQEKSLDVVASWNSFTLNTEEFTQPYINYVLSEKRKDSPELRSQFAKYELERKIIADEATKIGLDTLFEVYADIKQTKENAMRQVYMRNELEEQIPEPTEIEIREAFKRIYSAIQLEQIFSPNKLEIQQYYVSLTNGASFLPLAKESIKKITYSVADTSYNLGWVRYGMMDISAEIAAFQLKKNTFSMPVKSTRGWHIFKLIDIKETENVQVDQYKNDRDALKMDLFRRKLEESSQFYVDSLFAKQTIMINESVYTPLLKQIQQLVQQTGDENLQPKLRTKAVELSKSEMRNYELVNMNNKILHVIDYLEAVHTIPADLLAYEPQKALEFWLKNVLITNLARKKGLESDAFVIKETQKATINALYFAYLRNKITTLDKDSLANDYYESYKDIVYPDSILTTFEAYIFKDSTKIAPIVARWRMDRNFKKIIGSFKDDYTKETRTTISKASEIKGIPEHALPVDEPLKSQVFAGPYHEGDNFVLIAPVSRKIIPIKKERLGNVLKKDTNASLSALTHKYCLPKGYNNKDVILNLDLLRDVLPQKPN